MNERLTTAGEGRTHSFGSCMPPQSEAAVTLPEYVVIQPEPTTRSALVRVGPGSIRHTDCDQLLGRFQMRIVGRYHNLAALKSPVGNHLPPQEGHVYRQTRDF